MKNNHLENNLEYQTFCKEKYKPFFDFLSLEKKKRDIFFLIYFKGKDLIISFKNKKKPFCLVINNIELPPNVKFCLNPKNSIVIKNYPKESLPDNLSIKCNLKINDANKNLHYFGKNTEVYSLDALRSYLKSMENITVSNYVNLIASRLLIELPDNFTVNDSLHIVSSSIKKIGKNTVIKDSLYASCSSLEEIGDGLKVNKFADISGTSIKKMGKDIKIGDDFNIKSVSKLTDLGENLFVGNTLDICCVKNIKKINNTVHIGEGLICSYSDLEELPNNLHLRTLDISNTKIKKIGKNTIITNRIKAFNSELEEIPNDLNENGTIECGCIDIRNTKIKEIPLSLLYNKMISFKINTVIENIDLLNKANSEYTDNLDCFGIPISIKKLSERLSKKLSKNIKIINEEMTDNFNYMLFNEKLDMSDKAYEIYLKNMLLLKAETSLQKKLLLENFEEITSDEIEQYILKKENNDLINKNIDCISYCRSKQTFEFLIKNNYCFTEKEWRKIRKDGNTYADMYEMYLLKYNLIH